MLWKLRYGLSLLLLFVLIIAQAQIDNSSTNSGYLTQPASGVMVNDGFVSAPFDCSNAAAVFGSQGDVVVLTQTILFDNTQITLNGGMGPDLAASVKATIESLSSQVYSLASAPGAFDGQGGIKGKMANIISAAPICMEMLGGTALFWEIEMTDGTGWIMESIRWRNIELGHVPALSQVAQQTQLSNNDDGSIDFGPVMIVNGTDEQTPQAYAPSNLVQSNIDNYMPLSSFNTLDVYFIGPFSIGWPPPLSDDDEADEPDEAEGNVVCNGTAVSYLNPNESTYVLWRYNVSGAMDSGQANISLLQIGNALRYATEPYMPFDAPSNPLNPLGGGGGVTDPFGWGPITDGAPAQGHEYETLGDGPICLSFVDSNNNNHIIIWWQVSATVNGESVDLWYPESITTNSPGNYRLDRYYMKPESMVTDIDLQNLDPIHPIFGSGWVGALFDDVDTRTSLVYQPLEGIDLPNIVRDCGLGAVFGSGDTVQALVRLNLRDGIEGNVLSVIDAGTQLDLVTNAQPRNGYLWFGTTRGTIAGYDCRLNQYFIGLPPSPPPADMPIDGANVTPNVSAPVQPIVPPTSVDAPPGRPTSPPQPTPTPTPRRRGG